MELHRKCICQKFLWMSLVLVAKKGKLLTLLYVLTCQKKNTKRGKKAEDLPTRKWAKKSWKLTQKHVEFNNVIRNVFESSKNWKQRIFRIFLPKCLNDLHSFYCIDCLSLSFKTGFLPSWKLIFTSIANKIVRIAKIKFWSKTYTFTLRNNLEFLSDKSNITFFSQN